MQALDSLEMGEAARQNSCEYNFQRGEQLGCRWRFFVRIAVQPVPTLGLLPHIIPYEMMQSIHLSIKFLWFCRKKGDAV